MEGVSLRRTFFYRNWTMRMIKRWKKEMKTEGGFPQTGAEWKEPDELVRALYDMMKRKFYVCPPMTT